MHPSVASMARTLLSGAFVVYSGDPLRDLVLGAFLDRFAEKKPKARKQKEDGSMRMSGTEKTVTTSLFLSHYEQQSLHLRLTLLFSYRLSSVSLAKSFWCWTKTKLLRMM